MSKKLNENLGTTFKNYRVEAGLSQGQVSKVLGYSSPQFVSNFERGLCSLPLNKIKKLIDLYQLKGEDVVEMMLEMHEAYLRNELNIKKRAKPKKLA